MNRQEHLAMDRLLFHGRCYPMVHEWIDAWYGVQQNFGSSHWLYRHHLEAISDEFKGEMYLSAYMHILSDWLHHWNRNYVPVDRKDVIVKLKEVGYYQEGDWIE